MKLIDADDFIEFMTALEDAGAEHILFDDLRKFINNQPTAFDLESVIKQFEQRIGNYKNLNSDEQIVDAAIKEIERDLEILKSAINVTDGKNGG